MSRIVWPIPDKGLRKRLHRITAPTLLLWGDADRANPVVYAEEWQRRIKGAAVKLLPGGHMLLHEAPDASATALLEFLPHVGPPSPRHPGDRAWSDPHFARHGWNVSQWRQFELWSGRDPDRMYR